MDMTVCGLQELWLATCVFPYMFLMLVEIVESEDNIREVTKTLTSVSGIAVGMRYPHCNIPVFYVFIKIM